MMTKVPFETAEYNGGEVSITDCTRLKSKGIKVGSRLCMSCSHCIGYNSSEKYVTCRKKLKTDKS